MVENVVLAGEVKTSRESTLNNLDKDRQALNVVMETVNNSRILIRQSMKRRYEIELSALI